MSDQKVVFPRNVGVPTQVANPKRASWRTFVQTAIATLITLNVSLPIIATFLADNSDVAAKILGQWYGPIVAGVNFAVIVAAFVAKLIAQIMAIPAVNAWIEKYLPALAPIKKA